MIVLRRILIVRFWVGVRWKMVSEGRWLGVIKGIKGRGFSDGGGMVNSEGGKEDGGL